MKKTVTIVCFILCLSGCSSKTNFIKLLDSNNKSLFNMIGDNAYEIKANRPIVIQIEDDTLLYEKEVDLNNKKSQLSIGVTQNNSYVIEIKQDDAILLYDEVKFKQKGNVEEIVFSGLLKKEVGYLNDTYKYITSVKVDEAFIGNNTVVYQDGFLKIVPNKDTISISLALR